MGTFNTTASVRFLINVQRYCGSRYRLSSGVRTAITCKSEYDAAVTGTRCFHGQSKIRLPMSQGYNDTRKRRSYLSSISFQCYNSTTSQSAIPQSVSQDDPSNSSSSSKGSDTDTSSNRLGSPLEDGVTVIYFRGLPQITVPLPSRREKCRFIMKPLTNTVGDLLQMIQYEDRGIDRVIALSQDGTRIAASNTIEMLMEQDFNLTINETVYLVRTPPQEKPSQEELERLSSVRNLVGQLYAALNVDEHQLRREREMVAELESLRMELGPLEQKKEELSNLSLKKTNNLTWVGLGLMSVQFGILARLTWWEYSWDIMEPVTYFVTYGTAMLAYAYFVVTKQDYVLPEVRDRQYLITFHKQAKKIGLDVDKYNELRSKISKIENDLQRLRDPLALHLPLKTRTTFWESGGSSSLTSSQCIIGKAQQKFQEILQKAQKTSQST